MNKIATDYLKTPRNPRLTHLETNRLPGAHAFMYGLAGTHGGARDCNRALTDEQEAIGPKYARETNARTEPRTQTASDVHSLLHHRRQCSLASDVTWPLGLQGGETVVCMYEGIARKILVRTRKAERFLDHTGTGDAPQ